MSFIQFESGREKDKIRQQLREAREQMLEQAKKQAEIRAEREVQKELRGEKNWMLPAVAKKLDKLSKNSKPLKKSKKQKDKQKKVQKKSKKRRHQTSSSDSDSDTDTDSDTESSSAEEQKQRRSRKSAKKQHKKGSRKQQAADSDTDSSSDSNKKKSKKKRSKKRDASSSTSSSSSSEGDKTRDEWVESTSTTTVSLQRDSWMTSSDALLLKTFSRERVEKKPNEKQQIETYDPAKSVRELNPYWQSTGTGLPAFQKPRDDSDGEGDVRQRARVVGNRAAGGSSRNWQKKSAESVESKKERVMQRRRSPTPASMSASSASEADSATERQDTNKTAAASSSFLTDQQMNELGAKILKAEIMGNTDLAAELKQKLEQARGNRVAMKERKQDQTSSQAQSRQKLKAAKEEEEHILLTHTDERGNCRPLAQSRTVDPRDLYGGRKAARKQKRVETHVAGERVRYFADDDKYDIKQMFEREKYTSAADANLQFANIAGKHKNPNDDLEDIFADKIRKNIDPDSSDQRELHRAIHDQQQLSAQLDNCDKCFDSSKMDKQLLVCMGEKVYLALPWHTGLQTGHCLIVPTQHASCCTQLDEDTWEEVNNFRKALTRMFAAQRKDVIFFEIANKLLRRPHLSIHCVPIPESQGEMAPFYFKKAIEESEREWSVNKQLVSLRNKGLRSCIPKGLPYFWVNFGMDAGFAHVIEDQDRFPANFALEIIGGMLHLDAKKWRKPQKEQNSIAKVKMFADWWKKYDCTE